MTVPNGNIWILNKECYLDEDGSILDPSDSPFYWLSDHISNPAISPAGSSLVVKFPLRQQSFIIWSWRSFQWWNITPSALCSYWEQAGCRFITVRYSKHMGHCHRAVQGLNCSVTVAHGLSGKGKTTALLSELSLFRGQKNFSIQGGPKKASYQFWQGRQFLLA